MSDAIVPAPEQGDVPINEPVSYRVKAGEKLTVRYSPEQRSTPGFVLPILKASKHPDSTYTVYFDGERRFGPSAVPPTDIDDSAVTFLPALEFDTELRVEITNTSSSARTYSVQPVGFERAGGAH